MSPTVRAQMHALMHAHMRSRTHTCTLTHSRAHVLTAALSTHSRAHVLMPAQTPRGGAGYLQPVSHPPAPLAGPAGEAPGEGGRSGGPRAPPPFQRCFALAP